MPRTLFLALLAVALPLCTTAASVPRETYEVEEAGMEGTWRMVSWKRGGTDPVAIGGLHLVFAAGRLDLVANCRHTPWAFYKLSPPGIDLFSSDKPGARPTCRGFYLLRGDRLILCWVPTRPRPAALVPVLGTDANGIKLSRIFFPR